MAIASMTIEIELSVVISTANIVHLSHNITGSQPVFLFVLILSQTFHVERPLLDDRPCQMVSRANSPDIAATATHWRPTAIRQWIAATFPHAACEPARRRASRYRRNRYAIANT